MDHKLSGTVSAHNLSSHTDFDNYLHQINYLQCHVTNHISRSYRAYGSNPPSTVINKLNHDRSRLLKFITTGNSKLSSLLNPYNRDAILRMNHHLIEMRDNLKKLPHFINDLTVSSSHTNEHIQKSNDHDDTGLFEWCQVGSFHPILDD